MSIDVWGGGGVQSLQVPNNYDFTWLRICTIKNGKIYALNYAVSPSEARIYDKKMNLLQTITGTGGKRICGVSDVGYLEENANSTGVDMKTLSGTLIRSIIRNYVQSYKTVLLSDRISFFDPSLGANALAITDLNGSVLTYFTNNTQPIHISNNKDSVVYVDISNGSPLHVGKIAKGSVSRVFWQNVGNNYLFDYLNW